MELKTDTCLKLTHTIPSLKIRTIDLGTEALSWVQFLGLIHNLLRDFQS